MSRGIKLKVWGDSACFSRPEFKSEKMSYDVMTPTAAIGILECIHWHPAMEYVIDRIIVYNPIKYQHITTSGISEKIDSKTVLSAMQGKNVDLFIDVADCKNRVQISTLYLKDVQYVIEAHFELNSKREKSDNEKKHYAQLMKRARRGQCFKQPYLGCSDHLAFFELIEGDTPPSNLKGTVDLGIMLFNINFSNKDNIEAEFYHPIMKDGVINVPKKVIQ